MICFCYFFRILETVSASYQTQFHPEQKTGVVAALVLENQNCTKDIFETVILTAGSKFNCSQKCGYDLQKDGNIWAFCDFHAEALCYQLSGLYMLNEIYKLCKNNNSIFEIKDNSGYQLKSGIKFHLFISYHPCGFMSDVQESFLSWKTEFIGMPHIPQCSSKILIGACLGIQGPLSPLLVQRVFISSVVILHDKQSKKDLLCSKDSIEKSFTDFTDKIKLNSKEYCHVPTIHIIDEDLANIQKKFPNLFPPHSKGHQKSPVIGFVLPNCDILNVQMKRFESNSYNVSTEIKKYYQNVLKGISLNSSFFNDDRIKSLNETIKMLTSTLDVPCSLQKAIKLQEDRNKKNLEELESKAEQANDLMTLLKQLGSIKQSLFHKNNDLDKQMLNHLNELLKFNPGNESDVDKEDDIYREEVSSKSEIKMKHLPSKVDAFQKKILLLNEIQKMYESSYQNLDRYTLINVDCDWARYMDLMKNHLNI